jgi:methylenetetrahydrofolate dehydrogenase (NADP+)/methenyltetrahydrofolate cyclohydrolase
MSARLLDGRAIARTMLEETRHELALHAAGRSTPPAIRVVLVGDDPASAMYARRILKSAEGVGASGGLVTLSGASAAGAVRDRLHELSSDDGVDGIILQLPLPDHLEMEAVIAGLSPEKDLDGIHALNAGRISRRAGGFAPSCAEAAVQILLRSQVPLAGRLAVVVGRSNVVGRPAGLLLTEEDATVTTCHRQTAALAEQVRAAEIVVVAAGSPGLVSGDMVRPGAVLIDCGINVLADGSVVGDLDLPSVLPVAGAVTPVPGGVGPVTNAVLMEHLARAVRARATLGREGSLSPVTAA